MTITPTDHSCFTITYIFIIINTNLSAVNLKASWSWSAVNNLHFGLKDMLLWQQFQTIWCIIISISNNSWISLRWLRERAWPQITFASCLKNVLFFLHTFKLNQNQRRTRAIFEKKIKTSMTPFDSWHYYIICVAAPFQTADGTVELLISHQVNWWQVELACSHRVVVFRRGYLFRYYH